MVAVSFEAVLNILWVCLGLGAFSVLGWSEVCTQEQTAFRSRSRRFLCVVFATLFLFPCVSESDDLWTLANLQFPVGTRGEVGNPDPQKSPETRSELYLARFFEGLANFDVASPCALIVALLFIALVIAACAAALGGRLAAVSGRAPPALALS
jgi:hypothetical protein